MLPRSQSDGSLGTIGSSTSGSVSSKASGKVLGVMTSLGLGHQSQKDASSQEDVLGEEIGLWKYLVIDPRGIRARQDAKYSKNTKCHDQESRYEEGAVVEVARRRTAGWTKWLGLKSGNGWLFDVSPKDKKVRMVEVEVIQGKWLYECIDFFVPLLDRPMISMVRKYMKAKKRTSLSEQDTVEITEKVRPLNGKGNFLRLADGRGWVLDYIEGRQVLQRQWYSDNAEPLSSSDTSFQPLALSSFSPHGLGSTAQPRKLSESASASRLPSVGTRVNEALEKWERKINHNIEARKRRVENQMGACTVEPLMADARAVTDEPPGQPS